MGIICVVLQGTRYFRMCHVQNGSIQIAVVMFQPVQLAQASFLQKNQTLQNVVLISVMLRWHRASVACKNQSF